MWKAKTTGCSDDDTQSDSGSTNSKEYYRSIEKDTSNLKSPSYYWKKTFLPADNEFTYLLRNMKKHNPLLEKEE